MSNAIDFVGSVDMYELACKTTQNVALTSEEKEVCAELDARFKEIGKAGHDSDHEIAQFVRKTINEEIYNAPDELLDSLFERGNVGAYDDYEVTVMPPKNTLVAHEAAKGGNVERSYLDISMLKPVWRNRQIETDLSFADVARNGWKSVALLTEYAQSAFKNAMFYDVFGIVDSAIANGAENFIAETGTMPTQASMDQLALYLHDRAEGGDAYIVALSKYIQAISKMPGFVSEAMMNEIHRNGRLGMYDGINMHGISSAKRLGDNSLLIPDKKIFGLCGKIGALDMKGDINVYQVEDPNKEVFHLMFKDFTYGYSFNTDTLENVCKIELA